LLFFYILFLSYLTTGWQERLQEAVTDEVSVTRLPGKAVEKTPIRFAVEDRSSVVSDTESTLTDTTDETPPKMVGTVSSSSSSSSSRLGSSQKKSQRMVAIVN
jgi:hypothetical protein